MKIIVRPIKKTDIRRLHGIGQECGLGSWSMESYEKEYENPVARYLVAELYAEVVGFGGIWCVVDEAQIMNVGVLEGCREKGVATKLMEALIETAKAEGCTSMTLEVKQTNAPAIELYKKMGFVMVGARENYYSDRTTGVMMRREKLG